jgi:hypothetical protein
MCAVLRLSMVTRCTDLTWMCSSALFLAAWLNVASAVTVLKWQALYRFTVMQMGN